MHLNRATDHAARQVIKYHVLFAFFVVGKKTYFSTMPSGRTTLP